MSKSTKLCQCYTALSTVADALTELSAKLAEVEQENARLREWMQFLVTEWRGRATREAGDSPPSLKCSQELEALLTQQPRSGEG